MKHSGNIPETIPNSLQTNFCCLSLFSFLRFVGKCYCVILPDSSPGRPSASSVCPSSVLSCGAFTDPQAVKAARPPSSSSNTVKAAPFILLCVTDNRQQVAAAPYVRKSRRVPVPLPHRAKAAGGGARPKLHVASLRGNIHRNGRVQGFCRAGGQAGT